jgi:hypothetical protein
LQTAPRAIGRRRSPLRVVVIAVVVALAIPLPAASGQGRIVHAAVRTAGYGMTIESSTNAPYGVAYIYGQRLTIECIQAERYVAVAYTYSPFCLVCVDYESRVQLRGRLPNGERRWIALLSWGAGDITVAIRGAPESGPCGAPIQDTLYFPSGWFGYVLVA